MGKVRRSTLLGLTLSLLFVAGCKVSCTTANISSLKFSKDKEGTAQTNSFAAGDTVYAIATVSNNPGKVTIKFRLFAEKVEGMQDNAPVPNLDVSVDVPGDGSGIYTLKPSGAWAPGRYRVEAVMLYNGEQKDQETGTFTATGGGVGEAPPTRPAATPNPAGGDTPEENANESEDGSPDN